MMKIYLKQIFLLVVALLTANVIPAQDLPVLPKDPAIRNGVLPNGMHYYIAANSSIKGIADFALVQKTGTRNIADSLPQRAISAARDALAHLPRCKGYSPQSFFTSHGVAPCRNGFVRVHDDATIFCFHDVVLSEPAVADSVLLVLMDIVDRVSTTEDPFVRKWYSPSDQAIIVAGDVDASDLEYKMRVLSMMTPAAVSSERKKYEWMSADTPVFFQVEDNFRDLGTVSATWRSSRPPVESMNTVQPVIYEMFLEQLGYVASGRIKEALAARDIPVADVVSYFRTASESHEDESFTIEVSVADEHLMDAVGIMSSVMSSIDAGHTDASELALIKSRCIDEKAVRHLTTIKDNEDYVNMCSTAFLYNGGLSTYEDRLEFLSSRELSDETELEIFNSIAAALLDSARNLSVGYSGDIHPDTLAMHFNRSWKPQADTAAVKDQVRIPAYVPSGEKVKIRSEKTDPMSGGLLWTFSNGFRVVYKQMKTDGRMFYDLALNGGYGSIPDLEQGEGGYIGDHLFLSRICGMSSKDFLDALGREGIFMESYVGLSNMMLSGYAPKDRMPLVMRALLAVMNERELDEMAADFYARSSALRHEFVKGSSEEKAQAINKIMCPDYRYTPYKTLEEISPELKHKADRYFKEQSSKVNDGVLVLVGEMDPSQLKKVITAYAGGFRMTDKAFKRPSVKYTPASGWSVHMVEGRENSIDVAMSVPLTLTADNFMAAKVAAIVLENHLSKEVAGTGMYIEMFHDSRIYPHERFSIMISLKEASPDGYSSDTEVSGPIEALSILRSALADLSSIEVSEAQLKSIKSRMKSALSLEMKDPYYWLNVISRRYLAGKDFTSNSNAKIDAVTAARVKEVLSALNQGSKVEYITSIQ